ncbi:MAG: hypothetical protein JWN36_854 [Microbacteriaceae bacterium]|nr:hypothetical protein [Microbacteriaceae bacterium]
MDTSLIERFLSANFPATLAAVVGGSTARGTRTPTSDIDLLLVGPPEMFANEDGSLAAISRFEGELFGVFAYTVESFERWVAGDLRQYRPTLLSLLIEGVAVRGDALVHELRGRWRPIFDAGPRVEQHEIDVRRYLATDLLDDFEDARDPLEKQYEANELFEMLAQLILLTNGRWIGTGKWLVRRLREFDPERADALGSPLVRSDWPAFSLAANRELERLGGRVEPDFVR